MDSRQINHFLAAVEFGSLRRAAQSLEVSQPALTKSIRRLEESLEVRLFERHARGLRPTAFGEALLVHARTVQHEFELAHRTVRELSSSGRGLVKVGAGPSMSTALLPLATARLLQRDIPAHVQVFSGLDDKLLLALGEGDLDFAIAAMAAGPSSGTLTHEVLYADAVVIAAAAGHALAGRRLASDELRGHRWILPTRNVGARVHLAEFLAIRNLPPPEIWAETDNVPYVLEVVAQTDLLGYLPATMLRGSKLVALDVPGSQWQRVVHLSSWRRRGLTPGCAAFAEELRRAARELHP